MLFFRWGVSRSCRLPALQKLFRFTGAKYAMNATTCLCFVMVSTLLSPAKLQIILQGDCRRTRRTDGKRRITWPERLLLDLKARKSVDKTDGNPEMAAVAQSLGRPDVGHKEFPIFLTSHHATTEGPLTLSPTISLYAPLLLRNLRAFRMP